MLNNDRKIELLSPAKDFPAGMAAIKCGADAVYIGGPRFSAREAAGNSLEDIHRLIEFAHPYYVKIYVALNTLLYDHELAEAEKIIRKLYESGVDGLIIQDTGLLELDLPPIPLIASTQMHNATVEKIKFLEEVGFSRVILARELTLEQIREIRRRTSIELECFVHGALCVIASGQCYMSYALGGRSANRGQCAQPCRKSYSLEDAQGRSFCKDRYLLSLKDLNLSEHLEDLIDAGICSFKIEGRLKEADYVANVTAYYRQKLDNVLMRKNLLKSSSGSIEPGFIPRPEKSFNRGFTQYGVIGEPEEMGSIDTPKSIGEKIGKVSHVGPDFFDVAGKFDLHNADGICFFGQDNHLRGTLINRVEGGRVFPQKMEGIAAGRVIYRNYDHEFQHLLKKLPAERKIGLKMRLHETAGGFALEGIDEDGNTSTVILSRRKELAQNAEEARENLRRLLTRLGNTMFTSIDIQIDLAQAYFFPVSVLNQLRRDWVEAMLEKRLKNRPVRKGGILKNEFPYPQLHLDYTGNILNDKARQFYQRHSVKEINPAAESGLNLMGTQVMTTKYCIRRQLNLCPATHSSASAEPLVLIDHENRQFKLRFRCRDCGMDIVLDQL
jgi:23S rRNA 5-hydroxycytidine C2501 synthase